MPARVALRLMLLLLVAPTVAEAQRTVRFIEFVPAPASRRTPASIAFESTGGMPRWAKWGIAGAIAGGLLFAVAGQSNVGGGHSAAGDALAGAAAGFVVIGGGVALYDAMCAGDTRSRRSGLCGR